MPARKSSFYWGMRLLPAAEREPVGAIYAFCHAADDDVDLDPAKGPEAIARWRGEIESLYAGFPKDPIMKALHPFVRTHRLTRGYFEKILDGMEMDLAKRRYADLDELLAYCDCVAGAVGLLVLQGMRLHDDPRAREYSGNLAYGLQLTNILRDIGTDADIGRIYLPGDAMAAFGFSDEDLRKRKATPAFYKVGRFLGRKADEYFAKARDGLDGPLRRRLLGPEIMRATYENLLHRVVGALDLSLDGTPSRLTGTEKVVIAASTWMHVRFL